MFVTYTHSRPDGRIFYVGKGTVSRALNLSGRNPFYANVVKKYGKENIIVGMVECEDEQQAFALERHLIATCKDAEIPITNLTDGGEGVSNPSPEVRRKISERNKGRVQSAEERAMRSGKPAWNKGIAFSDESRLKMSEAKAGKSTWNKGISPSADTRKKIAEKLTGQVGTNYGRVFSEEWKENISKSKAGFMHTEESRRKIGAASAARPRSEATRLKQSIGIKAAFAAKRALMNGEKK